MTKRRHLLILCQYNGEYRWLANVIRRRFACGARLRGGARATARTLRALAARRALRAYSRCLPFCKRLLRRDRRCTRRIPLFAHTPAFTYTLPAHWLAAYLPCPLPGLPCLLQEPPACILYCLPPCCFCACLHLHLSSTAACLHTLGLTLPLTCMHFTCTFWVGDLETWWVWDLCLSLLML